MNDDDIDINTFEKIVDAIIAELPNQYPNWGTLRHPRTSTKTPTSSNKDFWTKTPLKSTLKDGGLIRYKWVRHHVNPRKTLFKPTGTKDGPRVEFLTESRTIHMNPASANGSDNALISEDNWTDPIIAQFLLEEEWVGKSIFVEETPIKSVLSLDFDEYMDLDYVTHKEAWDSLDDLNDDVENISMINTESESKHLSLRISQAETTGTKGTELDSHADSPVVGKHCYILRSTGRKVNVSGFSDKLGKPI